MTLKAKDLSPDQKMVIESLLGRSIAENEEISIRATTSPSVPEWLQTSWKSAQEQGLDQLSVEEIDAEIGAARKRAVNVGPRSNDSGRPRHQYFDFRVAGTPRFARSDLCDGACRDHSTALRQRRCICRI